MEDKKNHIIKAALRVFAQRGYSPVSLEEIAAEANLAKGTLYLYFKDKEDLFGQTVLYVIENIEAALNAGLEGLRPPFATLQAIAQVMVRTFRENPDFFGLFFLIHDPNLLSSRAPLFKTLQERRLRFLEFEKNTLNRAKARGMIRQEVDALEAAYLFDGLVSSTIMRLKFRDGLEKLDSEKAVSFLMELFLRGIATAGSGRCSRRRKHESNG